MRAYGRLLRLSLTASCVADVLGGALAAGGSLAGRGSDVALTLAASLGLYHGGMALNDWADRHEDGRVRPDRPLPSGAVASSSALALGLALLFGGVACAWRVGPIQGWLAAGIAGVVLVYDLGGRGPWAGPLALGAARGANLCLGMSLGFLGPDAPNALDPVGLEPASARPAGPLSPYVLAALVGTYTCYVVLVSRLGRFEDAPRAPEPAFVRRLLRTTAGLLLLIPALGLGSGLATSSSAVTFGSLGALAVVALAVRGLVPMARTAPREPRDLLPIMGALLRRLLVATSAMALLPGTQASWIGGLALVGLGYPVSHALRRVFPPS